MAYTQKQLADGHGFNSSCTISHFCRGFPFLLPAFFCLFPNHLSVVRVPHMPFDLPGVVMYTYPCARGIFISVVLPSVGLASLAQ